MKRTITLLLVLAVLFTGCSSGVAEESYQAVQAQAASLEEKVASLENVSKAYESLEAAAEKELAAAEQEKSSLSAELQNANAKVKELSTDYESLSGAFAEYKESMAEYEGLAVAEAEARKIQAEEVAASKAAAESKAKEESIAAASKAAEEEARKKAEEEKKGYNTGITYNQLARTPDDYEGQKVKFKGKVLQVIEGDDEIQIRLATKDGYDNVLYCAYDPSIVSSRVLEDDKITIYGVSLGLISYQSTMGGQITIPAVWVDKIDQ